MDLRDKETEAKRPTEALTHTWPRKNPQKLYLKDEKNVFFQANLVLTENFGQTIEQGHFCG